LSALGFGPTVLVSWADWAELDRLDSQEAREGDQVHGYLGPYIIFPNPNPPCCWPEAAFQTTGIANMIQLGV
jgi:hypothetical protein